LNKAEVFRLFECETLKATVAEEVQSVLVNSDAHVTIDNAFAAYMLNKRATLYGSPKVSNFTASLEKKARDIWLK
jgi:hypothetical protein